MSVQVIRIGADEGEQRLDRWLKKKFPQLNQIAIEKMCRKGELRVDGARAKQEVTLLLLPLAATSNNAAVRRLGAARWQRRAAVARARAAGVQRCPGAGRPGPRPD